MRILYASERPPFPFFLGGAARSAHYLLTILATELHVECLAVGSRDFSGSQWSIPAEEDHEALGITGIRTGNDSTTIHCGYPIQVVNGFEIELGKIIESFSPDVIWTQLDGIAEIAALARRKKRNVVVFLRDAEDAPGMLRSLADLGCTIVCNSQFMAGRIRRITGQTARVIYPPLETSMGVRGDPQGVITMINPHRVKGIDTFLEIAASLPGEQFLIVESWKLDEAALASLQARLSTLPNVRFQHRVPDVRDIYRQTKLLLAPSIWEEAFGRVVIEAQSCGIPVIASARGGLPESVGEGGILVDDYRNPVAWTHAIHSVLHSSATYQTYAERALGHASSLDFQVSEQAKRFLDICRHATHGPGIKGQVARIIRKALYKIWKPGGT